MAFRGDELFAFKGVDDNAFVCFTSSSAPVLYEHEKAFKYSVSAQDHVTVFERSGSLMFAANTLGVCIVVVHHGVTPFVGGKLLLDSAVSVLRGCESASDAVSVLKRVLTGQEVKGCTLVVADKGMLVIEMDFVLGRRVEHKNAVMLSRMRFEPTEGQEIHCFREETFKARCLSVTSHFDVTKKTPFSSVSDAFAFLRHHKTSEPCFSANGMCCCIYRTDGVPCRGSDVCIDWTCDRFGVVFDLKAARVFLIQGSRLCHTSFVPLNLALPPPNPKLVKVFIFFFLFSAYWFFSHSFVCNWMDTLRILVGKNLRRNRKFPTCMMRAAPWPSMTRVTTRRGRVRLSLQSRCKLFRNHTWGVC